MKPSVGILLATVLAAPIALAACGTTVDRNNGSGNSSPQPTCAPGAGGGAEPKPIDVDVQVDSALAAKLPSGMKEVRVASDTNYAPMEFTDASGKVIGFDVDVANAVGKVLGVKFTFVPTTFDGILAGLKARRFDVGMSSMTDNAEREKEVDFVTYFQAGTKIIVRKCNPLGVRTELDLCGKRVGGQNGTIYIDTLTKDASDTLVGRCKAASRPAPQGQGYPTQPDANSALQAGRIDASISDSQVVDYSIRQTGDQFESAGEATDVAPIGIPIPKGSTALRDAIFGALQKLFADGSYRKIVDNWGVGSGAIEAPKINAAS